MKKIYTFFIILLLSCTSLSSQEKNILTVYTYDSFNTEWGPGPKIEKSFEVVCKCDLKFVTAGDGAALLAKLKLEGIKTKADIVLGLDSNTLDDARRTNLFTQSQIDLELDLPIEWNDSTFVPFDWGYFAFVFDKNRVSSIPNSFEELMNSNYRIAIQDPRSSTPGLGLLLWIEKIFGDKSEIIWKQLSDNIVTVTPGWSEAYGLFLEGEVDGVLSYTTSPAYHIISEKDFSKEAAIFSEGHLMQVEVAAVVKSSTKKELAKKFMSFLISNEAQSIIPTTNWMYPAKQPATPLHDAFNIKVNKEKAIYLEPSVVPGLIARSMEVWKRELSK
jgi:thiamine transport system substrate-binding protein